MASASVLDPLRRPRFRRMVSAQFVAEVGDGVTLVALPLYVYDRTDSALITSLTFSAELTAGIFLAIIGGWAADAFNRRRVLLTSYVIRASLLVFAFALSPVALVIAFGVMARAMGQADNPSFDALVPDQAKGDLQQVLAVRRFIQSVSITIGPAIGAIAVAVIGARSALLLNAIAFGGSFVLMSTLRGLDANYMARKGRSDQGALAEIAEALRGMTLIGRIPKLRRFVLYQALAMAAVAMAMAAAVVWFERDLDVGDAWYGISISGYGIGAAVGTLWAGSRTFAVSLPRILLFVSPVYAAFCALGVAGDAPWLLGIGWLVWGIAMGPEMILGELFFVGLVPQESRGRGFAGLGLATTVGMAVGFGVAGPLLEAFSARTVILIVSILILALGAMWVGPALSSDAWTPDLRDSTREVPPSRPMAPAD